MVSIVIPNYNGKKYLRDCIESIYENTKINIEIIIIDNASADDNFEWIQEYNKIIFKKLDKNYGFSKAVNEGIKMAKHEYVLLLNNDTLIKKDFVENLLDKIKQDKNIFAVSSKMIQYNNFNYIDDAGDEYNILGWAYKVGDGKSVNEYSKSRKIFSACAGAALYRKSIFQEIGYFDENFFAYLEDVDISYRALIHGYTNVYCPTAEVYHIGSATSGSKYNNFKVHLAARNNIYLLYKNMPLIQLLVNMPFLLSGTLIKYIFFIKKGYGKEYKKGVLEGMRSLKNINKIEFQYKNIMQYFYIEILLIKNAINYIIYKLSEFN